MRICVGEVFAEPLHALDLVDARRRGGFRPLPAWDPCGARAAPCGTGAPSSDGCGRGGGASDFRLADGDTGDKNIPAGGLRFMADRAGSLKTVETPDASHSVMVSHREAVADRIVRALDYLS